MPKLGKRLRALRDMVTQPYEEIWDLCCDHGFLGMALLDADKAQTLHFVDQLPGITTDLAERLQPYPAARYQVHTLPAEQVRWQANKRRLVIIAGVGGETVVEIVQQLAARNDLAATDWLLSPANSCYELRQYLRQAGFGLKAEAVVFERRRGYEMLWLGQRDSALATVDKVGSMWRSDCAEHDRHLRELVAHYRRRLRNRAQCQLAEPVLAAYEQLLAVTI